MTSIPSLSDCKPGLAPTEFNVLIAPAELVKQTPGGIILPDKTAESDQVAQVRGRLVAISPLAFNFDVWPEGARRPEPGDEVVYAKYAGLLVEGNDGRTYRLCKDRDVGCIVVEEAA